MFYTLKQVAQKARLSVDSIYHWLWRYRHDLQMSDPARDFCERLTKIGKRSWRISEDDLNDWLQKYHGAIRGQPHDQTVSEELVLLRKIATRFREKQKVEEGRFIDSLAGLLEKSTRSKAGVLAKPRKKTKTSGKQKSKR